MSWKERSRGWVYLLNEKHIMTTKYQLQRKKGMLNIPRQGLVCSASGAHFLLVTINTQSLAINHRVW